MADVRGKDPLYDQGNTIAMTEQTKAIRTQRLIGERMGKLDRAVNENKEDVDWLHNIWSTSVAQFKEVNKLTLADMHNMSPEDMAQRIKPLRLLESEAGNIQQRIAKMNARFKTIDPNFSVFSHPKTAIAAQGLGVMTNGDRPSIFKKEADPMAGFLGKTATNLSAVALSGAEGATQFMADLVRPIGAAGGLVGDWILRGIMGEDGYNAALQKVFETTGFHPDFVGAPNVELRDEHGNVQIVKNRFGLPELVGPVGALLYGQHAGEFAANAREAKDVWNAFGHEQAWGWGLAADVSNFVGGMAGLGVATAPFNSAMMKGKTLVAQGMAAIGARTTGTAAKIADVLSNGAAQAAAFGTYETVSHGFMEGYTDSFRRGAETGLVFWGLGAMGHQVESLALRKEMPLFLSNALGAATEGVGMTAYGAARDVAFRDTPAGQTLWAFIKNPSSETWHSYQEELGKNVLGMVAFKAAFGRGATRENLLNQRLEAEAREGRKTVDEATKRQAGERTAQMLVDLQEGKTNTPMEAWQLARYHKELGPIAKEIGQQGREEAALGKTRGEPEQMLPGSLSGRSGTYNVEATENLAERMIRFNRKRDAARAEEGGGEGRELGVVGAHMGDRMVFTAVKGTRGVAGPEVDLAGAAKRLGAEGEKRGVTPEQILERAFTLHNHPGSTPFSAQDLGYFLGRKAATGADKHFVATDRGLWVAQTKGSAEGKLDMAAVNKEIAVAAGRRASDKAMQDAYLSNWHMLKRSTPEQRALAKEGAKRYGEAVTEVAARHGIDVRFYDAKEGAQRFGEFQKSGDFEKAFGEQRAPEAPSRGPVVSEEELAALSAGMPDVGEGSDFKEGGPELEATAPREGPAREPKVSVPRRRKGESVLSDSELQALMGGDEMVSEPTPEKQEALANAYKWFQKTKDPEVFFDIAGDQFGTEGLAKTPENVERLMRAAGLETGGPVAQGAPDKAQAGRTGISEDELLQVTRSHARLEAAAREMEKEGRFSKSLNRMVEAETYQAIADKVRAMRGQNEAKLEAAAREMDKEGAFSTRIGKPVEAATYARIARDVRAMKDTVRLAEPTPELPGALHEPTGGKEPSAPPPSDADAEKFLSNMFARRSKLIGEGPSLYQRMKGWGERFAAAFKNPSTRELIAERIEKAGYRSKFAKLGKDEEFVLAETDRLQGDLRMAPRLSMGDLGDIFEPITAKARDKKITPDGAVIELMDVQEYAVMRDQFDNRIRTHKELITDDAGKPVLDEGGNQQYRDVETENTLPGNLTPEQWQRALLQAEGRLTPEGKQAYLNMRKVLDDSWQSLVDRGLARAEDKQQNYYPRKVVDYEDFIAGIGPMRDVAMPKEPFRGFLKARKGSERMIDPTPEALMSYLTKVRLTNAVHDYNERVARGIEDRLLDELGTSREEVKDMTPQEWQDLRARAEKEHGGVVVDIRYGRSGQRTLERDPVTLDTIATIHALTDMRIVPEAVVGRNMRPDAELGRHLVTKDMIDLWRSQRDASSWLSSPLLRGIRRMIGKWFKGPALRGLGGARVFGRNVRNVISDETAIAFKDSIRAAAETTRLIPETSPVAKALAVRDSEAAIAKLSPAAQSLARELQRYNTAKSGLWTSEVEGMRDQLQGEWLKHYLPETGNFLRWVSKLARSDFRWANAVDNYAENLVRSAYFMRERMSALRDIAEGKLEPRPGESAETAATRKAHLQVSDVLVNYDWLTPLERQALNGVIFPFYTWARYNLTKQLAEVVRHPGNALAKYATYAGAIGLFNWLMAANEEDRLTQLRPDLAGKGHLFLPWAKDEFGNPLLLTWEDTFTAATDFLGLSGAGNKIGAYVLGHGNEELLMAQLFPQGLEQAQRALANATAPWIRQALDVGYRTSYQTVGERAENVERTVGRSFLPATDAMRYLGAGPRDESAGQRALTQLPMLRFIDLTAGVPSAQAGEQFTAGRIQREAAQVAGGVQHHMQRFVAGLKSGNSDMMQGAVDKVWAELGEQMTQAGQTEANLWARMMRVGTHQMLMQEMATSGMPPKFWQLSRTQQVDFLMRENQ